MEGAPPHTKDFHMISLCSFDVNWGGGGVDKILPLQNLSGD